MTIRSNAVSVSCVALGDTGHADRSRERGPHRRLRIVRHVRPSKSWPVTPPQRAITKSAPAPHHRARCGGVGPGRRRRHVPRSCGHGSKPTSSPSRASYTRASAQKGWRASSSRSSTRTAPCPPSGAATASTTRVNLAQRNVLIETGVLTDYMWDFLRSRKEGGPSWVTVARRATRTADGPHGPHLHRQRHRRSARDRRRHRFTASIVARNSAAGRSTPHR